MLNKVGSRRSRVAGILEKLKGNSACCGYITQELLLQEGYDQVRVRRIGRTVSASVSSLLCKMVKDNILEYDTIEFSYRGGYMYKVKKRTIKVKFDINKYSICNK